MPKKYYAVRQGRKTGIFDNWEECEESVKGFKNAVFQGFGSKKEALAFLNEKAFVKNLPLENEVFAYVDGSYNIKTKKYGYGVVLIFHNGTEVTLNGCCEGKEASMRNVAGELKGACIAMQYANREGCKKITVFHDYEGIAKWANKDWKANLEATKKYVDYVEKIRKLITVEFEKVVAHTGVEYNEKADLLAKEAVGIL